MPTRRCHPDVAALDNKIYVTGGWDGTQYISSVYCYDPDTNTWSQMSNMNIARDIPNLVSLHGKLYAIGGMYVGTVLESVEVYDPAKNTWTLLQCNMDSMLSCARACLLKKYLTQ